MELLGVLCAHDYEQRIVRGWKLCLNHVERIARVAFRLHRFRTGISAIFLMASLDRFWKHRFRKDVPFRKLIDRLIARPVSLIAGHLGYGTEITVYAVKQQDGMSIPPRAL